MDEGSRVLESIFLLVKKIFYAIVIFIMAARTKEFPSFGQVVRYGRETYMRRITMPGVDPSMKPVLISQRVIECLKNKDLKLSAGQYSEIESGIVLPRDPQGFLEKVASCLSIPPTSQLYNVMQMQLAYDVMARRLGKVPSAYSKPRLEVGDDDLPL